MKNKNINYIRILFETTFETICENPRKYKEDYIKGIVEAYQEFISIYGEPLDGMVLEHYKERLGIKDE